MANLTKGKKKGLLARLGDFFKNTSHTVAEKAHDVAEKVHIVKHKEDHKPGAGAIDEPAKVTGIDHASQQANEHAFDAGIFKGTQHGKSNDHLSFAAMKGGTPKDQVSDSKHDGKPVYTTRKGKASHNFAGDFNFVPGDMSTNDNWK